MRDNSPWIAARGQIAWILALLVSTAIVVQLERLELGARLAVLNSNPMGDNGWTQVLREARVQAEANDRFEPTAQVILLLSLSLAGMQPEADKALLATEAAAVIKAIGPDLGSDPLVEDAVALAQRVFGLSRDSPDAGD